MLTGVTNQEKMQEDYEDALFALAMNEYARQEGERLLRENERLKSDPAAAVPADTAKRCYQTIHRMKSRRGHKNAARGVGRVMIKAAIAVAVILALLSMAFAASPGLRTGVMNMLTSMDDSSASWAFTTENGHKFDADVEQALAALGITLEGLPEDYAVSNVEQERLNTMITYNNKEKDEIIINISPDENATYNFDVEDYDFYEETTMHGSAALVTQKKDYVRIAWADSNSNVIVCIMSSDLSIEEIKTLAEGIIIH